METVSASEAMRLCGVGSVSTASAIVDLLRSWKAFGEPGDVTAAKQVNADPTPRESRD